MKTNPCQLSLFDFVDDQNVKLQPSVPFEPAVLYHPGDRLFQQCKRDVRPCVVISDASWIVNENRFYRVEYDTGLFGIVNNESEDFFRNETDAEEAAAKWMIGKNVIPKEVIHLDKAEIYENVRDVDHQVIHAILLPLEGDLLYLKMPFQFTHVVRDNKKNRKDFYETIKGFIQIDIDDALDAWDLEPENMYRCQGVINEETEWLYASYGYRGAVG